MAGFDAVVIGGGVIGVTTAYYLHCAGLSVALLEKREGPALETSFANGGLITPSMSEPWASPGLPRKILGWIGKEDAPFLLRLPALPGLVRWGRAFLTNCNEETWRSNTRRMLALSRYSQACLAELVARERLSFDLSSRGALRLFSDACSIEAAERTAAVLRQLGIECRRLDARQCAEIEPALRGVPVPIFGGLHYPGDQSGDCHRFTQQLAHIGQELGVTFRYGTAVVSIEAGDSTRRHRVRTNSGSVLTDNVILATGVLPQALAEEQVRRRLPIYPVKGYSVTLATENVKAAPSIPIIDDSRKVGINRLGNRLRVVGTAEFCGFDVRVTASRIEGLMRNAAALLPGWQDYRIESQWAGLRPMTPHGIPYIGRLHEPGVWVSVGHGHLGWTNACGAAALIRDLICGVSPAIDPSDYAPLPQTRRRG